ncbi:flagellar motor switch protein FliM [Henriciella aquimarina]|uniref:flagellar motor switch protein FliM n=1 Tax=Henriciella aquimarina TaxID=545261 RepID=UPI001301A976|nr:FliM/FliN family flagellar motor switch protein [Henriciella aquimarina]
MQGSASGNDGDWAMSDRRARAVMRDMEPVHEAAAGAEDFRFPTPRGVLSKAEIEALLRPDLPTINDSEASDEAAETDLAAPDFDAPDNSAGSEEGQRIAARLSLLMAQISGLKAAFRIAGHTQFSAFETTLTARQARPGAAFICFGEADGDVSHMMVLPPALADAMVTQACGGAPGAAMMASHRALSAIDCALIEQLAAPLRSALDGDVRLTGVETEPDYAASLLPSRTGQEFRFTVKFAGQSAELGLIRMARKAGTEQPVAEEAPRRKPVTAILTARIASLSVPVNRLSGLKPGDTLLLGVPADQPVELLSGGRNGVSAFEGEVGRKGGQMAVRIRKRTAD